MNRQGQCTAIINKINNGYICKTDIAKFWDLVDSLDHYSLKEIKNIKIDKKDKLINTLNKIRKTLKTWNRSAGTITFLTKPILMFNWGQSPALDMRVRKTLNLGNNITSYKFVDILETISNSILQYEEENNSKLDRIISNYINKNLSNIVNPIPIGRAFDMIAFNPDDSNSDIKLNNSRNFSRPNSKQPNSKYIQIPTLSRRGEPIIYRKTTSGYNIEWGNTNFRLTLNEISFILKNFFSNDSKWYPLGASMTNPPVDGFGYFLKNNITRFTPRHASAIASILVNEGIMEYRGKRPIEITKFNSN